jgi:hypothetical protein
MGAYSADHGTAFTGATLAELQARYDASIKDVTVVRATATSYCIESVPSGPAAYHKGGPSGEILPGGC